MYCIQMVIELLYSYETIGPDKENVIYEPFPKWVASNLVINKSA